MLMGTDWHFKCRPLRNGQPGVMAWCARSSELGDGPLDVDFSLETHFTFADTEAAALKSLREEVYS